MKIKNLIDIDDFSNIPDKTSRLDYLIEKSIDIYSSITNPIIVSYSGGKDSTVLVILLIRAMITNKLKTKNITIIYSDTKMEYPAIHNQAILFLEYIKTTYSSINVIIVKRDPKNSFFVNVLGKGIFSPSHFARWCVKPLKIDPIKKYLKQYFSDIKYKVVVGIRLDESISRKKKYETKFSCDTQGECFAPLNDEERVFPILNWKNCNIWDFIQFHEYSYEFPIENLRDIYLQNEKTRYGCMFCTVASDFSLIHLTILKDSRFKIIEEIRKQFLFLTSFKYNPKDWVYYYRNSKKKGKGWRNKRIIVDKRKHLFNKIIDAEEKLGFILINEEEIKLIKEYWVKYPDKTKNDNLKYFDELDINAKLFIESLVVGKEKTHIKYKNKFEKIKKYSILSKYI
jgi:3'-phosphoadenosine 5'-phosphosulfate sulfotransferase (PAPS reductase)/FAD synthetase